MPADELAPTDCRESDFDHPWAKGLARLRLGRPISSRNQDTEQGRESRNRDRFRRFHVSANPRRERWTFEVQSLSQRFLAGAQCRRYRTRPPSTQNWGTARHGRGPCHRGFAPSAARLLPPRRAVPDSDAYQYKWLGRFIRRYQETRCATSQRTHSARQGYCSRDEPPQHYGRYFPPTRPRMPRFVLRWPPLSRILIM